MKLQLTVLITILSLASFAQQMTPEQWYLESTTNKRLLPKYGYLPKTEEEKKADSMFVATILAKDSTKRRGSDHMINLGFNYMNKGDLRTAMYRFNQAYLIDSLNTDIYWGFAGIYFTLGNYEEAKNQYAKGLSIDKNNSRLLTDYGTYFMAHYYAVEQIEKEARKDADSAIVYLKRSYELEPADQNTSFKLSVCYWLIGDCDNAWKLYDACQALGGQPITEEYTQDLKIKCKRK